jgi:hypothetical protein
MSDKIMSTHNIAKFLETQVLHVTFTKKDGTVREMRCTKNLDLIPADKQPKGVARTKTSTAVTVFDLDVQEWRSFLPESVQGYFPEK